MTQACDDADAQLLFVDEATERTLRGTSFRSVRQVVTFGGDYEEWLAAADAAVALPDVNEWDAWTIPYTSGTTGRPKGVILSHRARVLVGLLSQTEFGCFSPRDVFLAISPMSHGAGLGFPLAALLGGGTVEIMDRFDAAAVLNALKHRGVTGTFMVPTHFHSIFALGIDVLEAHRGFGLKAIIANAAPLSQAMKRKIVPFFGDDVLFEIYGSTESGLVTSLSPQWQLSRESCVGLPFAHTEMKVLDERGAECPPDVVGEVFSRSPCMFNGYWNRPQETAAAFRDGWLSVGDMGRRDADGFLYLVDRKNDMVITGGVNVYPREVEDVLCEHPAIDEVAVVGVPDERWGERLRACVVLNAGQTLSQSQLEAFCDGRLARFKIPRDLAILAALPRNANGKVLKRELRAAPPTLGD
jgi:long-chain acyl-CoA synthetase